MRKIVDENRPWYIVTELDIVKEEPFYKILYMGRLFGFASQTALDRMNTDEKWDFIEKLLNSAHQMAQKTDNGEDC